MNEALDRFRLDSKVAMVTGGSKGIGRHYAEALAHAGARIVVADIDEEAVAQTTDALESSHPASVLGVYIDVTDRAALEKAVQAVDRQWGRLGGC